MLRRPPRRSNAAFRTRCANIGINAITVDCREDARAAAERGLLAQLMSVQGTIARQVGDVRLGTEVMAARDPRDPWWVPAPFVGPALEQPLRVALTRASHGYPLVLSPFLMRPTFTWNFDAESEANAHDVFRAAIWSVGINYLGLPAGVLPTGMAAGMPAAVQLIGRRFREDVILDAMAAIEARVGVMTDTLWQRL